MGASHPGAGNALASLLEHVRVNHRGRHVAVAQQLLNRADVGSALEQRRGETVAESMRANHLSLSSPPRGDFDGLVYDAGVHVMAADDSSQRICRDLTGGKKVLPGPFLGCIRIFAIESVR